MKKKNRVYESITRHPVGPFSVRVWRQEDRLTFSGSHAVMALLNTIDPEGGPKAIAKALDAMPGVNAYEITMSNGNGAVVYPDWP